MYIPEIVIGLAVGFLIGVFTMVAIATIYGKKGDR